MDLPSFATSQKLALAGGGLAIAGVALPWATVGGVTYPGYYGDGFIAFMAGVSIVGLVLVRPWTMLSWVGVAVFAGISILVAGNALLALLGPDAGVGPGVLVQLVGGLLALAGSGYATREPRAKRDVSNDGYEWEEADGEDERDDASDAGGERRGT